MDILSFLLGKETGTVEVDLNDYEFIDPNGDGNIEVIEKEAE